MSQKERDVTYQSAIRFCEQSPSSVLELLCEDEIREQQEQRRATSRLAKIQKSCNNDLALAKRVQDFANESGISDNADMFGMFLSLLADVSNAGCANNSTS